MNLYKNIGKVVLDGSENWGSVATAVGNRFYLTKDDAIVPAVATIPTILSNNFSYITPSNSWTQNIIGISLNTGSASGQILIKYNTNDTDNVTKFKNWLSTHNTEAYYALATPYEVDLGIVDMPITYNETTNLFTDSDLLPQINAKYYRNFISTIQNLQVNEKALKQELIDINNRLSALETAQTSVASESEVIE